MPARRVDEPIEEFRVRNAAYQRQWQKARVTKQYDAAGNVTGKSVVRVPLRKPHERLPNTILARRSSLLDAEGNILQQWLIEKPEEKAKLEAWQEAARVLAEPLPRAEPVAAPAATLDHLLTLYPVGDHHLGMLSWRHETGDSYDLDIGERLLTEAMAHLVAVSPASEEAVIAFLGDFLHYDSFEAVTPANRNLLDADGRYPKVFAAGLRLMRRAIETAAARHGRVHVVVEIGNHDPSSAIVLMISLANIYENDPRITIDTSPRHFHYYEFGKVALGFHHGHGRAAKAEQLPGIMAADRCEMWGRTRYRYWHTGHVHHTTVKDHAGCTTESHRILPPADAYAAHEGYRAPRDMKAIVYHRDYGEVGRSVVNPSMLERKTA